MGYLRSSQRNQSAEQHHCTLSNLVLSGKFCEAVRFFSNVSQGDFYNPEKWRPIKLTLWMKPLQQFWREKIRTKSPPLFYVGGLWQKAYFYSCGYHKGCGRIGCTNTFRESGTWWYRLGSSSGLAFKIHGGQKSFILVLNLFLTGYPITIRPGQPIVNLCLAAWSWSTNSLAFIRLESGKIGITISISVCWVPREPKPPMSVRMKSFVPV